MIWAAVAILACLYLMQKWRSRLRFPGPRGWPLVGNSFQFEVKRLHLVLGEWAEKYGGVFKISLFGEEDLIISDPVLFHELQVVRGAEFAGRPVTRDNEIFSGGGKNLIHSQPSDTWRAMQKIVHLAISRGRSEEHGISVINQMLDCFEGADGRPVNPRDTLCLVSANTIATLLMQKTYAEDSDYFRCFIRLEESTMNVFANRVWAQAMKTLPFLKTIGCDLVKTVQQQFERALDDMVDLVQRESSDAGEDCLVKVMEDAVASGELPADHFPHMIADMLMGGTLTTTNTMYAFLNILINHSHVQQKLCQEIDDVIGVNLPNMADRQNMPYHQAVLEELFRYTTIAPLGAGHRTTKDTTVNGTLVPRHTTITFHHYSLNHNEKLFPQPYEFRPERYLTAEGEYVPPTHPNRKHMSTFGAGPRACLGEAFLRERFFLFVVMLLRRFTVEGDPLQPVSCDSRDYAFKGICRPPDYRAKFVKRDPQTLP